MKRRLFTSLGSVYDGMKHPMRRRLCKVLGGVCEGTAGLSDFFEGIGMVRTSRFIHFKVYNPLDDLHWYLVVARKKPCQCGSSIHKEI